MAELDGAEQRGGGGIQPAKMMQQFGVENERLVSRPVLFQQRLQIAHRLVILVVVNQSPDGAQRDFLLHRRPIQRVQKI